VNPPVTTQITGVSVPAVTNQSSITATFVANQTPASFVCSVDNGPESPCSSPASFGGFGPGAHRFVVRAVDAFGGVDPVGASYDWVVDQVAPNVLSVSVTVTRTSATITWTTDEAATSRVQWGQGSATDRTTLENFTPKTSHSVTITGLLPNTTYSYHVAGTDQAGNPYMSVPRRTFRTNF
jgi:hypothetical protein